MQEKIISTFIDFRDGFIELLPNLLIGLFFLLFFGFIGKILYAGINRTLQKRTTDSVSIKFVGQAIKWLFYVIGIIIALQVMGFSQIANSLLTGAGISALIVGFAFKDIFENFLSGILLAINRPFEIGNIVEIQGHKGTVKGLDLRTTHIRNVEGKDIFIPNSNIIKNPLINYTRDGYLRLDFDLGLDVPSDLQKAKNIILNHLKERENILKKPEPNVLITQVGTNAIDIKVLFWVNVLKDKSIPPAYLGITVKSELIGEIKTLLLENGFNIPCNIVEHKMYNADTPLSILLEK